MKAWVSGAYAWTAAQREALANDLTRPQLIAVSARWVVSVDYLITVISADMDILLPAPIDQNVSDSAIVAEMGWRYADIVLSPLS